MANDRHKGEPPQMSAQREMGWLEGSIWDLPLLRRNNANHATQPAIDISRSRSMQQTPEIPFGEGWYLAEATHQPN